VKVLCANEPPSKKEEIISGIEVKRLPYIAKIANTNLTPTLPLEIARSDFDVLHAHLPTPWSADWSMILAKLKNKPLILSYYNDIIGFGLSDYVARFYNSTALKLVLKQAARIIIIQENYLKSSHYLSPYKEKVVVVPCGVDIEKFRPIKMEENMYTLFFLSVLDEFHHYKGLDYLLQALKEVKKELPQVKLIVGGKGKLLPFYEEKTRNLGLNDNVEFLGFIPEEKLINYYNQCQAFVLPSISSVQEGFGIVALEALACGKPVISTEIVGIAEEIKKNGLGAIVPPRNTKALAESIISILSTTRTSQKLSKNCRKLVEDKYTWKRVAKLTEGVYQELI